MPAASVILYSISVHSSTIISVKVAEISAFGFDTAVGGGGDVEATDAVGYTIAVGSEALPGRPQEVKKIVI